MNTRSSGTPAVIESVAVRGNFFLLEPAWARCRQAGGIGGADSRVDKATVSSKRKIVCVRASKRATLANGIREYHKRRNYPVPHERRDGLPRKHEKITLYVGEPVKMFHAPPCPVCGKCKLS